MEQSNSQRKRLSRWDVETPRPSRERCPKSSVPGSDLTGEERKEVRFMAASSRELTAKGNPEERRKEDCASIAKDCLKGEASPGNAAQKLEGQFVSTVSRNDIDGLKRNRTDSHRLRLDLNQNPQNRPQCLLSDGSNLNIHYHSKNVVSPSFKPEGKHINRAQDMTASNVESSHLPASHENPKVQSMLPVKRKSTTDFNDDESSVQGSRASPSKSFLHSYNNRSSNAHGKPLKTYSAQHQFEERIVWPPVVIIENTRVGLDPATNKWQGLENEELRNFLKGVKDCEFGKVVSLYGIKGHRGKSLVIFRPDYLGFMDAQALSECLQRDNKGREHWERVTYGLSVSSMNGWNSEDLVTEDGKRILYGYLATEKDMMNADPQKKVVKRWSMESYAEKILEPMKRTEQGKKEARKKIEELAEEAKSKLVAVEQNKSEFGKKLEELKKVDEERQLRKKHEEELQTQHRRDFEARKRRYEEDKMKRFAQFRNQENEIRACLQNHKAQTEKEMAHYVGLARKWKDGINEETKKHQVKVAEQKQMEAMRQMELHSNLQVVMQNRLAALDNSFKEKLLKLQQQHNEEIMKSKTAIEAEREKLLQDNITRLHDIENEIQVAKDETEKMHKEAEERNNECIVCYFEFGTDKQERAFYANCNHANVCTECADELWNKHISKKEKPLCPTCKTVQTRKYSTLPGRVFL